MPERFITVQDAAEQLQVHPQTVRVWLRQGKLRGRLIGGRKSGYRIPASEVDRLLSPTKTAPNKEALESARVNEGHSLCSEARAPSRGNRPARGAPGRQ
jgi:excisionase family DNA binding protein